MSYKSLFLPALLLLLGSAALHAQIIEGFETGLPSSPPTNETSCTLSSGVWKVLKGAQTGTRHGGSYGLALSSGSSTASYIITPVLGTASTLTYWARGGGAGSIAILKSVNDGPFQPLVTQAFTSSFAEYTIPVNDFSQNVRLQFKNTLGTSFYLDDVTITQLATAIIAVSVPSLPPFGTVVAGSTSGIASFTVEGSRLSAPVRISASAAYKVALDTMNFSDSLSIPHGGGTLAATPVFVRFAPSLANGTAPGKITLTSDSAITKYVTVTGIAIAPEPSQQGRISFSAITGKSMTVSFGGGSGSRRILAARADSSVTYAPADGTPETGVNSVFSAAADKGDGTRVVYDGSDTSVTVTGLASGVTYHFASFEYNAGTNNSQNYLTASPAAGSAATLAVPGLSVNTSVINFGNVLINTISAERQYSLSAKFLSPQSGSVTVTAPAGFEVSLSTATGFAQSLMLNYTTGTIPATTLYIRFRPVAALSYTRTVVHSGGGADTLFLSVSGRGVEDVPGGQYFAVVAKDGSGTHTTVQAAFNAIPDNNNTWKTIFIKRGIFYEKDSLLATKNKVMILGEDRDSTVITYDDYTGRNPNVPSTYATFSVAINSDDVILQNLTIQNTATQSQAVALRVDGDRIQMYNCKLLGFQDTYYPRGKGRIYHKNCYIEGTTDFIFGWSVCVFDSCAIHIKKSGSTVTAASTTAGFKFGLTFRYCTISSASNVTTFYLGRPWKEEPRTVFLYCHEPATLHQAGWLSWNVAPALYAEYQCSGPGFNPSGRVSWSSQLTELQAAAYTLPNIFAAATAPPAFPYQNDWIPDGPVSVKHEKPSLPETIRLEQNYPNPFNPSTVINYYVPSAGHVALRVYDVLGKEIAVLADEIKNAGVYAAPFNASYVSSGIYYYSLVADGQKLTKKMAVLK